MLDFNFSKKSLILTTAVRSSVWPSSSHKNCSNDSLKLKICSAEAETLLLPRELTMVEPTSHFSSYLSAPELPHIFQCLVFTSLSYAFLSLASSVNVWQKKFFQLKAKYPIFHFLDLDGKILNLI